MNHGKMLYALASWLTLTGCDGEDPAGNVDPPVPPTQPAFVSTDDGSSPAVYLQQRELTPTQLSLNVRGRGLADVYGLAFRLRFDSNVATLAQIKAGEVFGEAAIAIGREPIHGLLVAAVTQQGAVMSFATTDDVLAVVELRLNSSADTLVQLPVDESAIIGADGTEQAGISWHGGVLELH